MKEASSESEAEEAKDFAANHLIPLVALSSLMRERPISKNLILRFAEQHRIATDRCRTTSETSSVGSNDASQYAKGYALRSHCRLD